MRHADYYRALISATLRQALGAFVFVSPDGGAVSVAAALPGVADRLGFEMRADTRAAIEAHLSHASPDATFVDGQGHTRPAYRPLALRAMEVRSVAASERSFDRISGPSPRPSPGAPGEGPVGRFLARATVAREAVADYGIVARAFAALLADDENARGFFRALAGAQLPNGTFNPLTSRDNPEPMWYDELAVLHAISTYARGRGDAELNGAVERSVTYHAAEVQPDHASSHPWAIAAFLDQADGLQLADMMLHAAGVQQPSAMDAVSLLLLADAVS